MSRRTWLTLGTVLLLAGATLGVNCQQASSAAAKPKPQPKAAAKPQPGKPPAAKPKAPVVIQAYYPLNPDHRYIAEYLQKLAKAHPGQVSVEVFDMQTPEGRKAWGKTGLTCAGVFVNGKTTWEVKRNGKTETVSFLKRMDIYWARKDFETVVNQLLARAKKAEKKPAK